MGKSLSEQGASKPYQGVRVKDPVKELLRRKRGNTPRTAPPTSVVVPNNVLPSYTHFGSSGFMGTNHSSTNESTLDTGALCSGCIAQPNNSATFQPLGQWASPQFFQHEQTFSSLPSLTTDMYIQSMCPSYAVVGPSSVLTLTPTPLFTNLGTISSSCSGMPQMDVQDGSLTYIPFQHLSPCQQTVPAHQLVPTSSLVSKSEPEQLEPALASEGTLALEKLLEEHEGGQKESYACSSSLFTQNI